MSNTITAYFKGRVGVAESVYQNDYGMIMVFDDIELPAHFDCYFSMLNQDESFPGVGADNRVAIPNEVLANPGAVTVHIPLHTGANDSEVEYIVYFKVIGRARPMDDGTPEQMTAIEQAIALLNHNNIKDNVYSWLDEHPEATTTVQDDSLTTAKIKDQQITLSKFADDAITNPGKHFAVNGENAVTLLGNVARSYINNSSDFVYGGHYAALRETVQQVGGKWEINCSTFAMLVAFGVSYENSAYQLGAGNNILDDRCCTDLELWDWFKTPWDERGVDESYKYTYDLAEWLYNHGYCFEPNDDLSNIKPGDMLLMKGQTGGDGGASTFRNIDHSCIFAYWNNDNMYTVWEVGSLPAAQQYFKSNLVDNCVLIARFPMVNLEEPIENIGLFNGSVSTSNYVLEYIYSKKNFTVGKYYTLIAKLTNTASIANVYPTVYQHNTRLAGYNNALAKPYDDIYIIPFAPTETGAINIRMTTSTSGITLPTTTCEWYNIVEGLHFSHDRLPYTRRLTVTLNEGFVNIANTITEPFLAYAFSGTFPVGATQVGTVSGNVIHGLVTPTISIFRPESGVVSDVEAYLYNDSLMVRNNTDQSLSGDMYCIIPIYIK